MQTSLFPIAAKAPILPSIDGLRYIPSYITAQAAKVLLDHIDAMPWLDVLKRRVQHYGYRYDYKARRITESSRLGPLPAFIQEIADRLHEGGLVPERPDQAIVNEYLPGQGISAHVDCEPCFGEAIVTLSLGSRCVMEFVNLDTKLREAILLEPCSVLVLQSEARHSWTHAITPKLSDSGIPRSRRVSLTFRRVILDRSKA